MITPELARNPINDFVDAHYDRLVTQGREAAEIQPLVTLDGISRGDVVRLEGETIRGLFVQVLAPHPASQSNFNSIGFTPEMQQEGLWLLRDVTYQVVTDGEGYDSWKRQQGSSGTYAHWNGASWHVARLPKNSPYSKDDWTVGWEVGGDLNPNEKDAVARIAQDTDLVHDAAIAFGDNLSTYGDFNRALSLKAQTYETPSKGTVWQHLASLGEKLHRGRPRIITDEQAITALTSNTITLSRGPHIYNLIPTANQYKLHNLAGSLHLALTGADRYTNSSEFEILQSVTKQTLRPNLSAPIQLRPNLYPRYENVLQTQNAS